MAGRRPAIVGSTIHDSHTNGGRSPPAHWARRPSGERRAGLLSDALEVPGVDEFGFELALCADLERMTDALVARQLGVGPGTRRILDVVCIDPGPEFEERAAISAQTIPPRAIEADVGAGKAVPWRDAFDGPPDRARATMDRAVEVGFLERERRSGRTYVRQAARYPDWFDRLRGIENKPDLATPGDLATQVRKDVALGVLDEVIVATETRVTGAHLHRLPDPVGVWQYDPETGDLEVVRPPSSLPVSGPGIEVLDEYPGRTDISTVTAAETASARRRLAERAYGKGWRTWTLPACDHCRAASRSGTTGLPVCSHFGRLVDPARTCGPACSAHEPGESPTVDRLAERDRRSPWRRDPPGRQRHQSSLERFR